jgi:membrane protein YqaA with SNARE-associated domain
MGELVGRVRSLALALGGPGLALVAFLDSTFLPLPGIADLLLVIMVTRRPSAMLAYVLLTVAGSVAGCLVMHAIGRKGGEALVQKRFTGEKTARAMAALQRNGVMAVLIPSLLPPPAPFKIFVLLAGVVGISAVRFAIAIALGRFARYFALGFLALRYGNRAMIYMRERGAIVSLVAVAALGAGFAVYVFAAKRRSAKPSGERRSLR